MSDIDLNIAWNVINRMPDDASVKEIRAEIAQEMDRARADLVAVNINDFRNQSFMTMDGAVEYLESLPKLLPVIDKAIGFTANPYVSDVLRKNIRTGLGL